MRSLTWQKAEFFQFKHSILRLDNAIIILRKESEIIMERKNRLEKEENFLVNNYTGAASFGDCTGLIPTGNCDTTEEFNSYKDIIPFCVPMKHDNDYHPKHKQ